MVPTVGGPMMVGEDAIGRSPSWRDTSDGTVVGFASGEMTAEVG